MRLAESCMRWVALLTVVLAFVAAVARAQAEDSASAQSANPNFDLSPAALPSVPRAPALRAKTPKPNDSIFSGVDLGGSTLNFQGDRKPSDTRVGAETFEPGTLVQS